MQEIQLELIRRRRFNTYDGEVIHDLLMRYRSYWLAVLIDRPGVPNYNQPGRLLVSGLIKLRDLPDDIWNVDTLFVWTHTPTQAVELAKAFAESDTGAMPRVIEDRDEIGMALGSFWDEGGLLRVWWD